MCTRVFERDSWRECGDGYGAEVAILDGKGELGVLLLSSFAYRQMDFKAARHRNSLRPSPLPSSQDASRLLPVNNIDNEENSSYSRFQIAHDTLHAFPARIQRRYDLARGDVTVADLASIFFTDDPLSTLPIEPVAS